MLSPVALLPGFITLFLFGYYRNSKIDIKLGYALLTIGCTLGLIGLGVQIYH